MRLPDARSDAAFQVYMNWAYTNILTDKEAKATTTTSEAFNNLIEMYLLGDYLDDVKFRNAVFKSLSTYTLQVLDSFDAIQLHLIWDHTTSDSILRSWAVDVFVSLFSHTYLDKYGTIYPPDFVLQVAKEAMTRAGEHGVDLEELEERALMYLEPDADA